MLLTDALALSHVPRWSVVRHSPPQSVADHSFRVAIIYFELHQRLGSWPNLEFSSLWGALIHDLDEAVTGDMPSFSKSHTPPKDNILKAADLIESYTYITMHGQGPHAADVAIDLRNRLHMFCHKSGISAEVVRDVCTSILVEYGRFDATTLSGRSV